MVHVLGALMVAMAAIWRANESGQPTWTQDLLDTSNTQDFVRFIGGDGKSKLAGRMYYPKRSNRRAAPATIILAHGIGLTQDCCLDKYVDAFTSAGFAAFTFDYASFGHSEGMPRNRASASRHVADLEAAVAFVKQECDTLQVDRERVGLWGMSFGGGHVIVAAANDPSIKAIVSLVPSVESGAQVSKGAIQKHPKLAKQAALKMLNAILRWILNGIFRRRTYYIPLIGPPGSNAVLQNPGDEEGYMAVVYANTDNPKWQNAASVGSAIEALSYRPLDVAGDVKCPALLIAAENDAPCPAKYVRDAADAIEGSTFIEAKGAGHFDMCFGKEFDRTISSTIKFFKKHL